MHRKRPSSFEILGITCFVSLMAIAPATAQQTPALATIPADSYRADRILILPKASIAAALESFHEVNGVNVWGAFPGIGGLQVLQLPAHETVASAIARYEQSGLVHYAEPDFYRKLSAAPNDLRFVDGTLWGLHNVGQNAGKPDADIDAPEAWEILNSASNIIVAVLDTGIRYTHEDLAANMWVNPIDDGHGLNAFSGTNDVADDQNHGTLVSGVLGAVGGNGKGVIGVAWHVQIMAGKCFDSTGNASDSTIIACMDYARTNGARIVNASFDSPAFSQSVSNAIYSLREAGIIFVASCGNGPPSVDVDVSPRYPACYDIDNIVSVAYTDRNDQLGFLSNYGATNVDLAAPGDQIYSTSFGSDSSYYPPFNFINVAGTSYAAPYVSGAFALLMTKFPGETHQQLIARMLNATDPLPGLGGKCVSGGRLNLHKALSPPIHLTNISTPGTAPCQFRISAGPSRVCVVEVSTNLVNWSPWLTNATSAAGTFDFTDDVSANSPRRFFRVTAAP